MQEDFTSIGEILNKNLDENPRYKFALKCSTIFSFWGDIVGKKFEKLTKPDGIKASKLKVLCKNAAVASELTMFKSQLLKKVQTYANPLEIQVNDILFSYKDWTNAVEKFQEIEDEYLPYINDEELNTQEVSEDDVKIIFESIEKLDFMPPETKENEAAIWSGSDWVIEPDFRGLLQVDIETKEISTIEYVGAVKTGFQKVAEDVAQEIQTNPEKFKKIETSLVDISNTEEYKNYLREKSGRYSEIRNRTTTFRA